MKTIFSTVFLSVFIPAISWGQATAADVAAQRLGIDISASTGGENVSAAVGDNEVKKIIFYKDEYFKTPAVNSEMIKLSGAVKACNASMETAWGLCLTKLSPSIQTGVATVSGLMSVISVATSTSQACSSFNKALTATQAALTAYNATCGGAQVICDVKCNKVPTVAKAVLTELKTLILACGAGKVAVAPGGSPSASGGKCSDPATCTACEADAIRASQQIGGMTPAISTTVATCKRFKWNLIAGAAGLFSVIRSYNQAKSCKQVTTFDCNKYPTAPGCSGSAIDCSIAANASKVDCICKLKPNTAGCSTAVGQNEGSGVQSTLNERISSVTNTSTDTTGRDTNFTNTNGDGDIPGATGVQGKTSGGSAGAGGSDGSGGFALNGTTKKAAYEKQKGLDTNILSGTDGMGGGGGGSSYGGDDSSVSSAYRSFMPGGEKDPSRGLASQAGASAAEVTGMGGKSNWEKVSESYINNKSKLLGGE